MLKTLKKLDGILHAKSTDSGDLELFLNGEKAYRLTRSGRIFHMRKMHNWSDAKEVESKGTVMKSGYVKTSLFGEEEYVHRIIAYFFCPNQLSFRTVNHKDGDKRNNNADNLEWCSYGQNHTHSYHVLGRTAGLKGKRCGRGVCFRKDRNKWVAYCDGPDGRRYLGSHETEGQARSALLKYMEFRDAAV